jgi:DNA-binding response OmpR family regulator
MIVIVDDELMICEIVVECFSELGAEVHCATNAADGAKLLAAHIFDLAIIDVQLPGQSGVDLIEMAVNRDIPVLMITGQADMVEKFLGFNIPAL